MILVSCRQNFSDPIEFGVHSCSHDAEPLEYSYSPLEASTVLIHGYHNTPESAQDSYKTIQGNLPDLKMSGYLWPGGNIAVDFPLAVWRAAKAGARLRDALNGCKGPQPIDIQTHSLGARVALEALKYGSGISIRHLLLTAPAVDDDSLDREFAGVFENCVSVNVFFSSRDGVLKNDFPLGNFFRGQALGLNGPKVLRPRLRSFDCSRVVDSHGGYRYAPGFYAAWRMILDGTAAPGLTRI